MVVALKASGLSEAVLLGTVSPNGHSNIRTCVSTSSIISDCRDTFKERLKNGPRRIETKIDRKVRAIALLFLVRLLDRWLSFVCTRVCIVQVEQSYSKRIRSCFMCVLLTWIRIWFVLSFFCRLPYRMFERRAFVSFLSIVPRKNVQCTHKICLVLRTHLWYCLQVVKQPLLLYWPVYFFCTFKAEWYHSWFSFLVFIRTGLSYIFVCVYILSHMACCISLRT